mgnify:CR=1 FL=1
MEPVDIIAIIGGIIATGLVIYLFYMLFRKDK